MNREWRIKYYSEMFGMPFDKWLRQKYLEERLSTNKISMILYGSISSSGNVIRWFKLFGIPLRTQSEAIKGVMAGEKHPQYGKRGSLSHHYNPNIPDEVREEKRKRPEYKDVVDKCFERDNWTCQKCGVRGGNINAHHIENWKDHPDKRYNLDNLVTLCEKCHKQFHSKYGWRHTDWNKLHDYLEGDAE